jgi:cell wall-active antibiotic response 4TMS protein YvqF
MNRYILIRRLRWPAVLLLLGTILLLHEADLVEFWPLFFPLLLILIGVLKLAERAALAAAGDEAYAQYYGAPGPAAPGTVQPQPGTSIVPAGAPDYGKGPEGGQS